MKHKRGRFYSVYTIEKTLQHHIIEWMAASASIIGAIMNAQLNIYGFYIFIVGNALWAGFAIKHRHWGLLATNILFFILNIYGVLLWSANPALG